MVFLWTEKYDPVVKEGFVGNSEALEGALDWAKKWSLGEKQPPLLLWGQTGSGKTSLAYLCAKSFGWNVLELNTSDLRSKQAIDHVVGAASQNASFFGSKRLILIDDVDCLSRVDRGGVPAIISIIKDSYNPVILTATDIFSNKSVSPLRFVCRTFEFKKINYLSMAKRLREILELEKIAFDEDAVKELARNSDGDMRSVLLDLQMLVESGSVDVSSVAGLSSRDRQQKVFLVMKSIFRGMSFSEARKARIKSDLSNDLLLRWVEENIPRQYNNRDAAVAFDRLSRADVFNGRIFNRQHWGFLSYSSELMGEGVCLSKERPSNDFVMYQFPGLLSMLSRTSSSRSVRKSLGKKLGSKTHSSSRKSVSHDLLFFREICSKKENAIAFASLFDLDEKELALLLNVKPDSKKVASIHEAAAVIREANAKPKTFFFQVEPEEPPEDSDDAEETIPVEESGVRQTRLF